MTTAQDSSLAPPGVAAGGATLVTRARPLAPALQLELLLAVLVTVTLRQRRHAAS